MNIDELKKLQQKATPGKLQIRTHPDIFGLGFVEGKPYEGHPYHNVASGFEIGGDEDYPTKQADMELIVALWNYLLDQPYEILRSVDCACQWSDGHVISLCGAHHEVLRKSEDRLAEKYRKLTETPFR